MKAIAKVRQDHPVPIRFCCEKLELDIKRYQRWGRLYQKTGRYGDGKPGSEKAPHRLLLEENVAIIEMAKEDTYADLSHRQLAVVASENGQVQASASSFYRVMKQEGLMEKRQREPKTPQEKPEIRPTGPNQIWSWDLTYISLGPMFVYLFAIIDTYMHSVA